MSRAATSTVTNYMQLITRSPVPSVWKINFWTKFQPSMHASIWALFRTADYNMTCNSSKSKQNLNGGHTARLFDYQELVNNANGYPGCCKAIHHTAPLDWTAAQSTAFVTSGWSWAIPSTEKKISMENDWCMHKIDAKNFRDLYQVKIKQWNTKSRIRTNK